MPSEKATIAEKGIATCCGKYGSFMFTPTKDDMNVDHSGEEFIFIVDCSGSMRGMEIILAAQCLSFFILSLPENVYFNVICFGTKFQPLFEKPVPYNNSNCHKALNLAKMLKANFGGTVLSNPLKYVFEKPLSVQNKLRRICVLTDGCVFDRNEVISLVKENSMTTMSNSIGIGYNVDVKLVDGIGLAGNGFVDFVLSGDDMRSKVIHQLAQSLNGLCQINISIENNETVEILPPLSMCRLSPGIPAIFYFKTSNELEDTLNIMIEIEGKSEPMVIEMKKVKQSSKAQKSLEYLFNNENIRILRSLDQTDYVVSKIIQLSKEYGILTPYTALLGIIENVSEVEKEIVRALREQLMIDFFPIFVRGITRKSFEINVYCHNTIYEIKEKIREIENIEVDSQRLILAGKQLEDEYEIMDYGIQVHSTIHLVIRLRGGARERIEKYPKRNYVSVKADDLILIVSEQKTNGCWLKIPNFFTHYKMSNLLEKVHTFCGECKISQNTEQVIGTISSLAYMLALKKECFQIWSLIYKKALKWLNSNDSTNDWNCLIHKISNAFTKENESVENPIMVEDNIIFQLDERMKTAMVIDNNSSEVSICISRSIWFKNEEFIIKSIAENSFRASRIIESIHFPLNSCIQSIEKNAFYDSSIEHLTIPSSLSLLKIGWCRGTPRLNKIIIMPNNKHFFYIDNKMIIGKSDKESDSTDVLFFVRRDIKNVTIPSFIKQIDSYAFAQSSIEKIFIPPNVTHIGNGAFEFCKHLKSIEIPKFTNSSNRKRCF